MIITLSESHYESDFFTKHQTTSQTRAIAIARKQSAKSLELRATTDLARLWSQQGKHHETRDILAEIYHWFTEGDDTRDVQNAKALLETLIRLPS